jgi:hypothetical protein
VNVYGAYFQDFSLQENPTLPNYYKKEVQFNFATTGVQLPTYIFQQFVSLM